ncbi:hypothetical protein TNCV_1316501 [Trichonephila clavipes]|nr:hypothetical protein TNCV_1316501 [Trichonephila clavipes]
MNFWEPISTVLAWLLARTVRSAAMLEWMATTCSNDGYKRLRRQHPKILISVPAPVHWTQRCVVSWYWEAWRQMVKKPSSSVK